VKTRESGMPEAGVWEGFFEPKRVKACGFVTLSPIIPLPPWHYGFTAKCKTKHKKESP